MLVQNGEIPISYITYNIKLFGSYILLYYIKKK